MVSKIIFFALLALSVVTLSECLKCYKCSGPVGSDCAKGVVSAMTIQTCSNFEKACDMVDITGAWTGRAVSRSCQSTSCDTLKNVQDIGVNSCGECGYDLCNTAPI